MWLLRFIRKTAVKDFFCLRLFSTHLLNRRFRKMHLFFYSCLFDVSVG